MHKQFTTSYCSNAKEISSVETDVSRYRLIMSKCSATDRDKVLSPTITVTSSQHIAKLLQISAIL